MSCQTPARLPAPRARLDLARFEWIGAALKPPQRGGSYSFVRLQLPEGPYNIVRRWDRRTQHELHYEVWCRCERAELRFRLAADGYQ